MRKYICFKNEIEKNVGIKIVTVLFTKEKKCDNIELVKWIDLIIRIDFSNYEGNEIGKKTANRRLNE